MNKSFLRSAIALAISSLFATTVVAAEQPKAEDLVGRAYAGLHLFHIETDEERLLNANPLSSLNNGDGFGAELGYRLNTSTELRLGFTKINLDAKNGGFNKPNASNIALDVLYFPNEQNFYLLAGLSELDIVESELSSNLGLGYRHYLSEKTAVYFEAKAHYQFDEYYDDFSAQLGFTYFFGESTKSTPKAVVDSDNDGIADSIDLCKESGLGTKVDATGCALTILDTDKDGVADSVDQCNDSLVGAIVDATGCTVAMLDSDKDGVADSIDQCNNSTAGATVNALGCAVTLENSASINLSINFDNNKSVIKPEFIAKVEEVANFLKANKTVDVIIEGHASAPGKAIINKALSQARANSVVNMLINDYKIDANRLSAIGYGEERLINTATTTAANAENRRIVATVKH